MSRGNSRERIVKIERLVKRSHEYIHLEADFNRPTLQAYTNLGNLADKQLSRIQSLVSYTNLGIYMLSSLKMIHLSLRLPPMLAQIPLHTQTVHQLQDQNHMCQSSEIHPMSRMFSRTSSQQNCTEPNTRQFPLTSNATCQVCEKFLVQWIISLLTHMQNLPLSQPLQT